MRSLKGLLVLMLLFVFAFSVVAASKEDDQSPQPAGAAQTTTPEGVSKEKAEKAPAQSAPGTAPVVKPPAPPGKSLKDEGC